MIELSQHLQSLSPDILHSLTRSSLPADVKEEHTDDVIAEFGDLDITDAELQRWEKRHKEGTGTGTGKGKGKGKGAAVKSKGKGKAAAKTKGR